MEFDEMKKIWDTQNNEPLYVLDEKTFNNHVLSKIKKTVHLTNLSERVAIFVNIAASVIVLGIGFINGITNISMYAMIVWMLITAIGVTISRVRRIRGQRKFDRSILGDLDHAVATATYQVVLSGILRLNLIPMGVFIFLTVWEGGKAMGWTITLVAVILAISFYASGWEHNYYKSKKKEVQQLRNLLISETKNVG